MKRALIALTAAVALLGLMGSTAGATTTSAAHGGGDRHGGGDHRGRGGYSGPAWNGSAPSAEDVAFLNAAWQIGLVEVYAGTLAERQAANPLVAELGDRAVHDHFVLLLKQAKVMQKAGIPFPGLDAGAQAKLAALNGSADFDAAYLDLQVAGHTMDLALFQNAKQSSDSWAVKKFAKESLRTLQEHLWMGQMVSAWLATSPVAVV